MLQGAQGGLLAAPLPEERYRELCRTFPHWPARLTQVQLANYIGISPVTLSRIRRRINTG
ncbi:cyclic nucleotide-binding protein [Aeromonas hydrophila]|nr:cyclic nucleotide-binding protein [Aeromonas hydrophila]